MTSLELAKEAVKVMDDKKALNLKVIGIKDISVLADYFVLATGTSSTHVKALADETEFRLKQVGISPLHTEGYHSNSWIVLDYSNVIGKGGGRSKKEAEQQAAREAMELMGY